MKKHYPWIILIIIAVAVILLFFVFSSETVVEESEHVVMLENVSSYTISPGVLAVHNNARENGLMNYLLVQAPPEYEPLAEVGNPADLMLSLRTDPSVYAVYEVPHIEPGQKALVRVNETYLDAEISYMGMIVQTNDGVVWNNGTALYDEAGVKRIDWRASDPWLEVLDMGTEENSPIGSGFEGGQPDPSRGAENIDNGVATEDPVRHYDEFYSSDHRLVRLTLNPSVLPE